MILPVHRALDAAREEALAQAAIGTTGRGIGPAYEARVARTGIRVQDLLETDTLVECIGRALEERNYLLENLYAWSPFDPEEAYTLAREWGTRLEPYVDDVSVTLDRSLREGRSVLLEGAQGTLLDIDHFESVGMSHIAARSELREMIAGFELPEQDDRQDTLPGV